MERKKTMCLNPLITMILKQTSKVTVKAEMRHPKMKRHRLASPSLFPSRSQRKTSRLQKRTNVHPLEISNARHIHVPHFIPTRRIHSGAIREWKATIADAVDVEGVEDRPAGGGGEGEDSQTWGCG